MSTNTMYKVEIGIPYGKLNDVITWCVNNIDNDWKYSVVDYGGKDPGHYEFLFNNEKDYVKFLMWNK